MKRHVILLGFEHSPNCERGGEEKTSFHVMTTCPGLAGAELYTVALGKPIMEPGENRNMSIDKIMKFALQTDFWWIR